MLVEHRLRVLGRGHDLAAEQAPVAVVGGAGIIECGDVHQLVVHELVHALGGSRGLEREGDGRYVDDDRVRRHGYCAAIAVIREVEQQDRRLLRGLIAQDALLAIERVVIRFDDARDEIGLGRIEVQESQLIRFGGLQGLRVCDPGKHESQPDDWQDPQCRTHRAPCFGMLRGRGIAPRPLASLIFLLP